MTFAFAYIYTLRDLVVNPDESHIGFAIGDCMLKMEQEFGHETADRFAKEFLRLRSSRDYVLSKSAATLIYLQGVEYLIKGVCSGPQLKGLSLTVADFLSDDPARRRVTLGQLKRAIVATQWLTQDFEREFDQFVEHRNQFVHSL
ncbi:MAG: hypothetical protein ACE5Q6_05110 [Dehalococcoidia bacterium]